MTFKEYPKYIRYLANFVRDYLDDGSKGILIDKASDLENIIKSHKNKKKPLKWNIVIPIEHPLKFCQSSDCKYEYQIDLSCKIGGEISSLKTKEINFDIYNVTIRIWSCQGQLSFRDSWDAKELKSKIESQKWKRVVLRFHFDRKLPDTAIPEPIFHMHVGGVAQPYEFSWFPKQLGEPRFHFFPLDLILLFEFILFNFFPQSSRNMREAPEWKSMVIKSQALCLKPHIEKLAGFLSNGNDTLLGHLTKLN